MAGAGSIRAGRAFVELFADDSKLQKSLSQAQNRLAAFGKDVTALGARLTAASAVVAAPLVASLKTFADMGDALTNMSNRTGIGVAALSELGFAVEQSGATMEEFEASVKNMQKGLVEAGSGSASAAKDFADLGLSVEALRSMRPEEQFAAVADRIADIPDPARRAHAAMQVFGKGGAALLPLMKSGAAGIDLLRQRARELGLTIEGDTAAKAQSLGDSVNVLKAQIRAAAFAIGNDLRPELESLIESAQKNLTAFIAWAEANKEAVVWAGKLAVGLGAVGGAMLALGTTINVTSAAIASLRTTMLLNVSASRALAASWAFLAANPYTVALAAITTLTAALVMYSREAKRSADATDALIAASNGETDTVKRRNAADIQRLKLLTDLSKRSKLTNDETRQAQQAAATLASRYGDMGITVGAAGVQLTNAAAAMERLTTAMRDNTVATIERQIRDATSRVAELRGVIEDLSKKNGGAGPRSPGSFWLQKRDIDNLRTAETELESLLKRQRELREQRAAINAGNREALTGLVNAADAEAAARADATEASREAMRALDQLADMEERAARERMGQLDQEIAKVNDLRLERLGLIDAIESEAKSRPGGISPAEIESLAERRKRAEMDANQSIADAIRKSYEDEDRARQEAIDSRLRAERELADEIARLRIEATMKGAAKEQALRDLEMRRELEQAQQLGVSADMVKQKYDLLGQIDAAQQQTGSRLNAIGTFSAGLLSQLAGGDDGKRTAAATEATAKNTKLILEALSGGGTSLAFA